MGAPQYEQAGADIGGTGTPDTIPRWTGPSTLGDSLLSQSGAIVTNSGTFRAANGAATEPAYTFSGSSGTGMYRATSGALLRFAVSSNFAFGVDTSGNVGIGTTSPVGRTDIAGTSVDQLAWGLLSVRSSDAQGADKGGSLAFGGLYDATNSTHWAQISGRKENGTSGQYGGYLAFATRTNGAGANTERARIDSAGNFGIGVIPSAWASSVRAEEMRTHARWNYNSGSDSVAYWTVNAFLNSAGNNIYKATAAASQYTQIGGAHVWERAVSGTAGNTVTWLESARIDSAGNFGVATSTMVAPGLTVTDPTNVNNIARANLRNNNSDVGNRIATVGYNGNTIQLFTASESTGTANNTLALFAYNLTSFYTGTTVSNPQERMRIDSSGNVGIGTASPDSRLHVSLAGLASLRIGYAGTSVNYYDAGTHNFRDGGGNPAFTITAGATKIADLSVSGWGLKLPATPGNADAQTLDCYQENPLATTAGNGWTPTLSAAATWGGTQPNVTYARYVRMGSIVFCEVKLTMATGTMTSTYGTTTIDSPFTTNTNATHAAVPVAAPGASGVGFQSGTTVYLPTIGASSTFILTWSFFA